VPTNRPRSSSRSCRCSTTGTEGRPITRSRETRRIVGSASPQAARWGPVVGRASTRSRSEAERLAWREEPSRNTFAPFVTDTYEPVRVFDAGKVSVSRRAPHATPRDGAARDNCEARVSPSAARLMPRRARTRAPERLEPTLRRFRLHASSRGCCARYCRRSAARSSSRSPKRKTSIKWPSGSMQGSCDRPWSACSTGRAPLRARAAAKRRDTRQGRHRDRMNVHLSTFDRLWEATSRSARSRTASSRRSPNGFST